MGRVYRTKRQIRIECDARLPSCQESTNWFGDNYLNHAEEWALADGWTRRLSPQLREAVVNETSLRSLIGDTEAIRTLWICPACSQSEERKGLDECSY